ncbi:hypothetical protein [Sorangium sp. So ce1000]|uniref:hypothetical protein n=1 Tax=Sorangium sp. So ce1000 TaxID=3133325 RepID=UPI003F62CB16
MDALGVPDLELTMKRDMDEPLHAAAAPRGDEFHEIDLAALNPDPEHIRKIQKEAVKSAMLSVADLRQGRRRHDSLTLSEWTDFTSAPRPGVMQEG